MSSVLAFVAEFVPAGAVAAIALRVVRVQRDRLAWTALGGAMLAWLAGDIYRALSFPPGTHRFFPSPADAGYLLLYPFAYAGLWLLLKSRARGFPRSLWLDGLIGATGVGAVGASLLIPFVLSHSTGDLSTVATNVAYPLGDLLLIAQLVMSLVLGRWRVGRADLYLGAGLTVFAGADAAYAYCSATGHTYVVATGALWVSAFVLVAIAAWQRDRPAVEADLFRCGAALAVPVLFALVAIGLLAYGQIDPLPDAGATLALITLVLVMLRTALTFRENLTLLDSRRASLTDELTGLPNRRRLGQRMAEMTGGQTVSPAGGGDEDAPLAGMVLVDLDGFKELNDTLGHHAGDLLLAGLGPRLSDLEGIDLVARLGGDEFAALITGRPDPDAVRDAAARLQVALETPFEFDDLTVHVRASIGGTLYPEHGADLVELMRHADVAMYHAKSARTGYELYRPDRDLNSRDRLRLVGELQRALRDGELILHYQPKAEARTGVITGVEALVRWQHPVEGLLGPERFLDVAESAGLMRQLTSYVLERALCQLARWNAAGADLYVAVNLAMPNLLDLRLPEEVERRLCEAGVPADRLILEITENIVMADPDRILDVVGRLDALGVVLSLDDFGAGASSLGYIKRLTVAELKIDRSFVMTMDDDEDNAAIVRATIELAHNLGLRVVAEGVETEASFQSLRALGCDEVQGFLLGRPVTAADLEPRLMDGVQTVAAPPPEPAAATGIYSAPARL